MAVKKDGDGGVAFLICFRKRGYPERKGGKGERGKGGKGGRGGVPALEETKSLQCAYFVNDGLQSASMN